MGRTTSVLTVVIAGLFLPLTALAGQTSGLARALRCNEPVSALSNGVVDLDGDPVRLTDRKACLKAIETDSRCEWTVELTRAERWGPGQRFLLVVVHADHGTGTGVWDYVRLFDCREGIYAPVFSERFLYGARVVLDGDLTFVLSIGIRQDTDAMCCPSRRRESRYAWDDRQRQFTMTGTREVPIASLVE